MNILPSGNSYTFTLLANHVLTVTSRGGTTVTGPSGLLGAIDGTKTFGGYSVDTVITITAIGNDCEFGATEPANAGLATDSAGNKILTDASGVTISKSYPIILGRGTNILRTALGDATDAVESTLASVVIPGGLLGSNGTIEVLLGCTASVSTPDKPIVIYIAGQSLAAPTMLAANTRTTLMAIANMAGSNQTMESLNMGFNPFGQATGAVLSRSIDMTVDQTLTITQKWTAAATAGNTFRILNYVVLAYPGTIA